MWEFNPSMNPQCCCRLRGVFMEQSRLPNWHKKTCFRSFSRDYGSKAEGWYNGRQGSGTLTKHHVIWEKRSIKQTRRLCPWPLVRHPGILKGKACRDTKGNNPTLGLFASNIVEAAQRYDSISTLSPWFRFQPFTHFVASSRVWPQGKTVLKWNRFLFPEKA